MTPEGKTPKTLVEEMVPLLDDRSVRSVPSPCSFSEPRSHRHVTIARPTNYESSLCTSCIEMVFPKETRNDYISMLGWPCMRWTRSTTCHISESTSTRIQERSANLSSSRNQRKMLTIFHDINLVSNRCSRYAYPVLLSNPLVLTTEPRFNRNTSLEPSIKQCSHTFAMLPSQPLPPHEPVRCQSRLLGH